MVDSKAAEREFFPFENGLSSLSASKRIELLKELGYSGIGSAKPSTDLAERFEKYRKDGLHIYSLYLGTTLEAGKPTPVPETIIQSIEAAKNQPKTVIELYVRGKKDKNTDDEAVEFVRAVADLAKTANLKVVLYPHTNFYIETLSDAVRIARKADRPNVGVMFNLCHYLKVEPKKDLKEELSKAGQLLWRVSTSGADVGGKNWQQLIQPLDQGTYDQSQLLAILDELEYSGPIGLQCYGIKLGSKTHLQQSIVKWRAMHGANPPSGKVKQTVSEYKTVFHKYNSKPHRVNAEVFALCRGVSYQELETARRNKTGPHLLTSINIYLNKIATAAVANGSKIYPEGSIVIQRCRKVISKIGIDCGQAIRSRFPRKLLIDMVA